MTEREKVLAQLRYGDLDGLKELQNSNIITDTADKEELEKLILINDVIGIGWGEDLLGLGEDIWQTIEQQYFDRKPKLLEKYNLLEVV